MIQGALRSALTEKYNGNSIVVVDQFTLPTHKTKDFRKVLSKIDLSKKLLIVESGKNENLELASGNLTDVKLVQNKDVNVYDLLKYEQVVFSKAAIERLQEALNL
jgi:large subunit ribosomal protein L4